MLNTITMDDRVDGSSGGGKLSSVTAGGEGGSDDGLHSPSALILPVLFYRCLCSLLQPIPTLGI